MMVYVTTVIDSTRDPPPQPSRGPRHRQSGIPDVDTLLLELANGQAGSITGPMVTMGAVAGDPVAVQSFEAVGTWLGHGMADLAAILDPRVFIVGGGVSEAGELLVGPARRPSRPS
jgi:glucokinase